MSVDCRLQLRVHHAILKLLVCIAKFGDLWQIHTFDTPVPGSLQVVLMEALSRHEEEVASEATAVAGRQQQ